MKHLLRFCRPVTLISLCLVSMAVTMSSCQSEPKPKAGHVIIIGLDGTSSICYHNADMPYLKSMAQRGAYALKKRSCLPSSSAINWASILCGSNPELHGYLTWGSRVPDMQPRAVAQSGTYTSIFRLVRDQRPDAIIGFFYDWDGMKYFSDTAAMTTYGEADITDIRVLTDTAVHYIIRERPTMAMFAFDHPDHEGHSLGWGTPQYMDMLHRLDSCVEAIVEATRLAGIYDDCIFVVIADHGGIEQGHGQSSMSEIEAPFIIWGHNIRPVGCLDDDYSMMNFDVGAILAEVCGVTPPQSWTGRSCFPIFK